MIESKSREQTSPELAGKSVMLSDFNKGCFKRLTSKKCRYFNRVDDTASPTFCSGTCG